MQQKKKICKSCSTEQYLFSKGRCLRCTNMEKAPAQRKEQKPLKQTPLKRKPYKLATQAAKTREKRKVDREGFGDFFVKHIQIIQEGNLSCQECGKRIIAPNASNVAHILGKSKHLEVATNDLNVLYLCGMFSDNQCHAKFDSTLSKRKEMSVFPLASQRYELIKHLIVKSSAESRQFDEYLLGN